MNKKPVDLSNIIDESVFTYFSTPIKIFEKRWYLLKNCFCNLFSYLLPTFINMFLPQSVFFRLFPFWNVSFPVIVLRLHFSRWGAFCRSASFDVLCCQTKIESWGSNSQVRTSPILTCFRTKICRHFSLFELLNIFQSKNVINHYTASLSLLTSCDAAATRKITLRAPQTSLCAFASKCMHQLPHTPAALKSANNTFWAFAMKNLEYIARVSMFLYLVVTQINAKVPREYEEVGESKWFKINWFFPAENQDMLFTVTEPYMLAFTYQMKHAFMLGSHFPDGANKTLKVYIFSLRKYSVDLQVFAHFVFMLFQCLQQSAQRKYGLGKIYDPYDRNIATDNCSEQMFQNLELVLADPVNGCGVLRNKIHLPTVVLMERG